MHLDLDWRAVRAFLTVVERGGYTAAARELGVTQSAVSHALRRLEEHLDCRLLTIQGKAPRLTPEGNQFFQSAKRAMEQMERAVQTASSAAEGRSRLRIIFSASIARVLLPSVLREYRDCYPDLKIDVGLQDTPGAVQAVENGQCDLALGIKDNLPPGVHGIPLFRDELHLAVSPGHPLAKSKAVGLKDLVGERFIAYHKNSVTQQSIEKLFLHAGVRPAFTMEVPNFEVIKELVKLGLGISLIAPWMMAEDLENGSLVAVPMKRPLVQRCWCILQQKHRRPRPCERTFVGLCRMAACRLERIAMKKAATS